jgi:uncharacterized protein YqhQ
MFDDGNNINGSTVVKEIMAAAAKGIAARRKNINGNCTIKMMSWKPKPKGKYAPKNRGVMHLEQAQSDKQRQEHMQRGQAYTTKKRREYAIQVICTAIDVLRERGEKITIANVSRISRMHRNTISRTYAEIVDHAVAKN